MKEMDKEETVKVERAIRELDLDRTQYEKLVKAFKEGGLVDLISTFCTWILMADQRMARIEQALQLPKGKGLIEIAQWIRKEVNNK